MAQYQFFATHDDRTCEECLSLAGFTVSSAGGWNDDAIAAAYPHGRFTLRDNHIALFSPNIHPRCRCYIRRSGSDVKDVSPEDREYKEDEVDPYTRYHQQIREIDPDEEW